MKEKYLIRKEEEPLDFFKDYQEKLAKASDLEFIFYGLNLNFFNNKLKLPTIRWNSRLRASAGRFIPGRNIGVKWWGHQIPLPPVIEIAEYLKNIEESAHHVKDTMAHEMIHYWLWANGRPYGHTSEFKRMMHAMGVSRYNTVPLKTRHRYVYACPRCEKEFLARKKWKASACLKCCKTFNNGVFHVDFKLFIKKELSRE